MEKIKALVNQYLWLIILIWLLAIGAFVFWLSGQYQETKSESAITQSKSESNKAVQDAVNAEKQAVNSSVERRAEDTIRERTITPKLDFARRQSQNSKIELEKAKQQYNETSKIIHNSNVSRADNCAELSNLFPNQRFEYCQ